MKVDVMILNVSDSLADEYALLAGELACAGIVVELPVEAGRLGRQFKMADVEQIPIVIVLGDLEHAAGTVRIKDMRRPDSGYAGSNETDVTRDRVVAMVVELLGS
jgi:histidyl-tRNA synthetase